MILQRYIGLSLAKGWLLVLLVLSSIFGLISFIQELGHTRFDYNTAAVARYTLLILPNQMMGLAPVIALLGSIVALANLDRFFRDLEVTLESFRGRLAIAGARRHRQDDEDELAELRARIEALEEVAAL